MRNAIASPGFHRGLRNVGDLDSFEGYIGTDKTGSDDHGDVAGILRERRRRPSARASSPAIHRPGITVYPHPGGDLNLEAEKSPENLDFRKQPRIPAGPIQLRSGWGVMLVDDASASTTRLTLLSRLRHGRDDDLAWREFVSRYGPKIESWCIRWGLQEADAQDVTQTVLLGLAAKLRSFHYKPGGSFRGWLRTIARHAWIDFVSDRRKVEVGTGDSGMLRVLETIEARDDLERRLAQSFDLELLQIASARVRGRVEPHTWEAFRLTALEGLSGAESASRLGIPILSVFKAKSNVQKMLQEEMARLEDVGDQ